MLADLTCIHLFFLLIDRRRAALHFTFPLFGQVVADPIYTTVTIGLQCLDDELPGAKAGFNIKAQITLGELLG